MSLFHVLLEDINWLPVCVGEVTLWIKFFVQLKNVLYGELVCFKYRVIGEHVKELGGRRKRTVVSTNRKKLKMPHGFGKSVSRNGTNKECWCFLNTWWMDVDPRFGPCNHVSSKVNNRKQYMLLSYRCQNCCGSHWMSVSVYCVDQQTLWHLNCFL